ncbi:MAG TPA: hypothetical protein VGH20_21045 [Myxococcales bacterium]
MSKFEAKRSPMALAHGADGRLPSHALQELWFATLRASWQTLVLVPVGSGLSALPLARALGEFGGRHRGRPVTVMSTSGLELSAIADLVSEFGFTENAQTAPRGGKVIVAIDPIVEDPMGIAAALAADAALLCLELGKSRLADAQHTLEQIGRERFIGCVVLRPSRKG